MEDGMAEEPAVFLLARQEDVWLQVLTRLPLRSLTAAQPVAAQKAKESWLECLKSVLLLNDRVPKLLPNLDGSVMPPDWTPKDDVREAAFQEVEFCCATLVAAELGIPFRPPGALSLTGTGTVPLSGTTSRAAEKLAAPGDDCQDLVDVIAWAYSLAHAVSAYQLEGQQRLETLFIRVMDIYVAPGFALLLTKKEPPATLAAANAIIGSVHAHVCALGCALSAVFSYLDVNVGGSVVFRMALHPSWKPYLGLFPLFSALLRKQFPRLALAREGVRVAKIAGANDGSNRPLEWAPGGSATALVATVFEAISRDCRDDTWRHVRLSNAQPLLEFSQLFNEKADAVLGAVRWPSASSEFRSSSGRAERSGTERSGTGRSGAECSKTAGTEDGLSNELLPTAAHIRVWSNETQSFKRASLPGLCVHESAFLLRTQEAVRTSMLASGCSPRKTWESQSSIENLKGFAVLPPLNLQVHFPSLARGSALRAFATYFTHRACSDDDPVRVAGNPLADIESLVGLGRERFAPRRPRNLTDPRELFAALVRDTTIGRQEADGCCSSDLPESDNKHEHSYILGMALNFFGVAKMLKKDSRVLGTGFERPRGRQSRRSSDDGPALELLLGVDRTSRTNSRRTSGAD